MTTRRRERGKTGPKTEKTVEGMGKSTRNKRKLNRRYLRSANGCRVNAIWPQQTQSESAIKSFEFIKVAPRKPPK